MNEHHSRLVFLFICSCVVGYSHALSSSTVKTSAITAETTGTMFSSSIPALSTFDYNANNRLPWIEEGYGTWEWRGEKINYVEMGDPNKPALLLIHGFGASSYHFRYNIPILAREYHVYAFDLLGFGLSSKPIKDYSANIWRDQAVDFISDVIQKPTTVAGNSLGGYTALYTAATESVKPLIEGCILLNAAGRFKDPTLSTLEEEGKEEKKNVFVEAITKAIQRLIIGASFIYTKQPARIEQVLRQVYPVNADNVDQELVESIRYPSLDPNAAEVFYRVITKNGSGPQRYVDDLLERLDCPLLLCWGEEDPWIRSQAADRIQSILPRAQRISIDAGHCPHDEDPEAVNNAILSFMKNAVRTTA